MRRDWRRAGARRERARPSYATRNGASFRRRRGPSARPNVRQRFNHWHSLASARVTRAGAD